MYRSEFGTKNQVRFDTAADYYEFLGYLAKDDGTTQLVWEHNDEQGAWAQEGRIHFKTPQPAALRARLDHTAGTGSIVSRVIATILLSISPSIIILYLMVLRMNQV